MNEFNYKITEQVYNWIISGTKRVEVRLYNDKARQIKVDDIINFTVLDNNMKSIRVKVTNLYIHKNIHSLLKEVDIKSIADVAENTLEEMLYEIFGEEEVKNHNIIGIKFEVIEENKDILIDLEIDKKPYIKELTDDKIINLTGQSGAGKSYYAKQNFNNDEYLVIDTDEIFSEERFAHSSGINRELGEMFRQKYKYLPNCGDDFDLIYQEILDYCKDLDKTIVIDSATFHCIKDINLLKGKIIIMRTSINTCYKRCIERFKEQNPNCTNQELNDFKERKKKIYVWYKFSNEFIKNIDKL